MNCLRGISKSYATGLLFIVLVAIIWSAASLLVQYVYTGGDFHSPFLLTYIGVSLFTIWLPANFIQKYCKIQLCYRFMKRLWATIIGFGVVGGVLDYVGDQKSCSSDEENNDEWSPLTNGEDDVDDDDDDDDDDDGENDNNNNDGIRYDNSSDDDDILEDASDDSAVSGGDTGGANRRGRRRRRRRSSDLLRRRMIEEEAELFQNDADDAEYGESGNNNQHRGSKNGGSTITIVEIVDINNNNNNNSEDGSGGAWTHYDHFITAIKIVPVWFIANWTYNASLAYTSITSSTVLACTSSLFTFIFAIFTNDETFNYIKLFGVLLGVMGSTVTAYHDAVVEQNAATTTATGLAGNSTAMSSLLSFNNLTNRTLDHGDFVSQLALDMGGGHYYDEYVVEEEDYNDDEEEPILSSTTTALLGDFMGLISAIGYGAYAIQFRIMCPKNEQLYSMQLLLGYIGLVSMVALSPIALYSLIQINHGETKALTLRIFMYLVIKGFFDNALADYLWLRAVMLTSATVATVGLGLTIPMAFVCDVFWNTNAVTAAANNVLSTGEIIGALMVLSGFVLVNVGNNNNNSNSNNSNATNTSSTSTVFGASGSGGGGAPVDNHDDDLNDDNGDGDDGGGMVLAAAAADSDNNNNNSYEEISGSDGRGRSKGQRQQQQRQYSQHEQQQLQHSAGEQQRRRRQQQQPPPPQQQPQQHQQQRLSGLDLNRTMGRATSPYDYGQNMLNRSSGGVGGDIVLLPMVQKG